MKFMSLMTLVAAMIAAPSAAIAVDEDAMSRTRRDTRQADQQQQTERRPRDSQTLRAAWRKAASDESGRQQISTSGEILRMKKVDLRGRDASHTVALLRTERGKMGVVDLGPVKQLQSLKLQQGDRIEVRGKPVRVNKRGVLMANSIRKSGQRVGVDRMEQPVRAAKKAVRQTELRQTASRQRTDQARQQPKRSSEMRSPKRRLQRGHLAGEVIRTKQVDVRGSDEKQMVVLIETERGNRIPVDLGPTSGLKDVKLSSGDRVRINGFMAKVGEKQLVVAEQLAVARDQTMRPDRDDSRRRGGKQADRGRNESAARR
jgi:hypothetical protein